METSEIKSLLEDCQEEIRIFERPSVDNSIKLIGIASLYLETLKKSPNHEVTTDATVTTDQAACEVSTPQNATLPW